MSRGFITDKAPGKGLMLDTADPTYGWRDLEGQITTGLGGSLPTSALYRGGIRQFQFSVNNISFNSFHMPHDYVPGSDMYIHVHWSHNATTITGGTLTWTYEISYSKGHNQAPFGAPVTGTITSTASTTQYQHLIDEVQFTAASPSASQIDSDILEVDGLILCAMTLTANNLTISGGAGINPFLHFIDIHYQSTSVGTKNKAPNFYE